MSTISNEDIVRNLFEEAVNKGNLEVVDELYAKNFVDHCPGPGQKLGPAGIKHGIGIYRAAFPDLQVTVENVVSSGEQISTRETWHGTHLGQLRNHEASGRELNGSRMHLFRIVHCQIVEEWSEGNLIDQLGL